MLVNVFTALPARSCPVSPQVRLNLLPLVDCLRHGLAEVPDQAVG
jgi:hypothetical protein